MKVLRRYTITADDRHGMYPRPKGKTPEGIDFYFIAMPPDSDILSAGEYGGNLCVRVVVDNEKVATAERRVAIIQDGDAVPKGVFVGTVGVVPRVEPFAGCYSTWHVFDLGEV